MLGPRHRRTGVIEADVGRAGLGHDAARDPITSDASRSLVLSTCVGTLV
jgi:hypothetical protein